MPWVSDSHCCFWTGGLDAQPCSRPNRCGRTRRLGPRPAGAWPGRACHTGPEGGRGTHTHTPHPGQQVPLARGGLAAVHGVPRVQKGPAPPPRRRRLVSHGQVVQDGPVRRFGAVQQRALPVTEALENLLLGVKRDSHQVGQGPPQGQRHAVEVVAPETQAHAQQQQAHRGTAAGVHGVPIRGDLDHVLDGGFHALTRHVVHHNHGPPRRFDQQPVFAPAFPEGGGPRFGDVRGVVERLDTPAQVNVEGTGRQQATHGRLDGAPCACLSRLVCPVPGM